MPFRSKCAFLYRDLVHIFDTVVVLRFATLFLHLFILLNMFCSVLRETHPQSFSYHIF